MYVYDYIDFVYRSIEGTISVSKYINMCLSKYNWEMDFQLHAFLWPNIIIYQKKQIVSRYVCCFECIVKKVSGE